MVGSWILREFETPRDPHSAEVKTLGSEPISVELETLQRIQIMD
jgi:hypothetical protein